MMRHYPLIAVLLFFSFFSGTPNPSGNRTPSKTAVLLRTPIEEDNTHIPWSYTRKLSWNDFQCEPQRHTDAVALTSTSLGLAYQINNSVLTYEINCTFAKDKSWGLLKTDYILAHEQGHFDITEIYARKLNKAMQQYQFNASTYKQDINDIYENIVHEKETSQQAYDGQTDHSRNRKVQMEWLKKIESQLAETAPYAVYP
jgi:hypothetical protein